MGITREHVNSFYLITRNLEVEDFIRSVFSLLDKSMSAHDNEELPFGVVPMLSFCDAWFADVD